MSLFTKEAVSHQSKRLTGAITLAQPLSIKLTILILVSIAVAIISFLFSAEYSHKETVRGFLMPNKGVIKSFASQAGTIEKLWVKEGDNVLKGQSLATIIVQQNIVRLLLQHQNKLNQITFNIKNIPQQYTLRINNLKRQQADLQRQLAQIASNYKYTITASNIVYGQS